MIYFQENDFVLYLAHNVTIWPVFGPDINFNRGWLTWKGTKYRNHGHTNSATYSCQVCSRRAEVAERGSCTERRVVRVISITANRYLKAACIHNSQYLFVKYTNFHISITADLIQSHRLQPGRGYKSQPPQSLYMVVQANITLCDYIYPSQQLIKVRL